MYNHVPTHMWNIYVFRHWIESETAYHQNISKSLFRLVGRWEGKLTLQCHRNVTVSRIQGCKHQKLRKLEQRQIQNMWYCTVNCITLGSIQKHVYFQGSQSCAASSCCTILQDFPSFLWERRLPSIDLSSSADFTTLIMLTHKSANVMCCAEVRGGVAMGFSSTKCTNVMVASRSIT